jgi:hypothetical protein
MSHSHDCSRSLCDTPHYEDDVHAHDWTGWNLYPECDGCLATLAQYIHEETDFVGCPMPELCDYSPDCQIQYRKGRAA